MTQDKTKAVQEQQKQAINHGRHKRNELFRRDRDNLIEKYNRTTTVESGMGGTLQAFFASRCNRQNATKKHKDHKKDPEVKGQSMNVKVSAYQTNNKQPRLEQLEVTDKFATSRSFFFLIFSCQSIQRLRRSRKSVPLSVKI